MPTLQRQPEPIGSGSIAISKKQQKFCKKGENLATQ